MSLRTKSIVTILSITLLTLPAHAGFFSGLANAFSKVPGVGNLVDSAGNRYAHRKLSGKIRDLERDALRCQPLESDNGLTVRTFMRLQPGFPKWKRLKKLEKVAKKARDKAEEKSSNDKVRHCYAGCFIGQKLSYSSGVLAGFLKELKDASDCESSTRFELEDYYATVAGATAARKVNRCESFCGAPSVARADGSEMLKLAHRLKNR